MKVINFEENLILNTQRKKGYVYFDERILKFIFSEKKLSAKCYKLISKDKEYKEEIQLVITTYNLYAQEKGQKLIKFHLVAYINNYEK